MIKKVYHIFSDGEDRYTKSKKEAEIIYKEMCKRRDNVRLYSMNDDEDLSNEEYLKGIGDFPQ